ncbi:uncharacterized protein N7479_004711 [Penicillium vulpinum]|uniref:uncharacterized protein n=1 Tax=Penicillium vulpinum TaxID=29845 RepID=UPI002548D2BB|nr:uncharacterized protein N7479_004711 [Penicillium vulpinum]KAJ5964835.1 hypothetical protein N7479_004711 [Penicillium vulpinum]
MVHLLDLPAGVILSIVDYLQMGTNQVPLLFYELEDPYSYVISHDAPPSVKHLHSFMAATHRLNNPLLQAIFYRDISVRSRSSEKAPLQQLNHPSLQEHIISATIPRDDSISDFHHFFWLPNIRTLTIIQSFGGEWEWSLKMTHILAPLPLNV